MVLCAVVQLDNSIICTFKQIFPYVASAQSASGELALALGKVNVVYLIQLRRVACSRYGAAGKLMKTHP